MIKGGRGLGRAPVFARIFGQVDGNNGTYARGAPALARGTAWISNFL